MKEFDPSRYNAKYEQKYFYLPRIIRKGSLSYKDLYKNKSVRIIILIITLTLKKQNEYIFDSLYETDDKISKNQKELNKIKEDSISTLIIENKKIPKTWSNKSSYLKILKKILDNNDEMKQITLANQKYNQQRELYNSKLKENLPLLQHNKSAIENSFGYDNDLLTLVNNKRNMKKVINVPKIKSINEEYKLLVKKLNKKITTPKPDSLRNNLKNILEYRKKIALRFKYSHKKFKDKQNSQITKSKSQIINSLNKYKIINDEIKQYEINAYEKEYEDKLMITGMNNKKFKNFENDIILEES